MDPEREALRGLDQLGLDDTLTEVIFEIHDANPYRVVSSKSTIDRKEVTLKPRLFQKKRKAKKLP